jgi:molybdopterin synthase sulfur carrier subunit
MPVKVRIPTPLRTLTNGAEEVTVEGNSIKEVIDNLETNHVGIKERICDEKGQIRRFINFYLNDEDIRFKDNQDTPVNDGDQISIVPAIAGGVIVHGFHI